VADCSAQPVRFKNSQGNYLFGMYHPPSGDKDYRKTAVVLLSPGVKMRVGPHRMYNSMAEHFTDLGFAVLRFDFWGLGDSEGNCSEKMLADLYGHVQVGRYIQDTSDAMDWLSASKGYGRFVLGGLCGGAITGLLTAAEDTRCLGVLSLGMPVILDSADVDQSQYMTNWQRVTTRNTYLKKILNPRAWLRLLSLRSDYRLIWRSFFPRENQMKKSGGHEGNGQFNVSNVNPLFAPKFFRFMDRGGRILLIFSRKDRLVHEYEEKFAAHHRERLNDLGDKLMTHIIPGANHILSRLDWKEEMLSNACSWLDAFD